MPSYKKNQNKKKAHNETKVDTILLCKEKFQHFLWYKNREV